MLRAEELLRAVDRELRGGSTTAATSPTGCKVNFSGRLYTFVGYGVSRETMMVDYDEVLALAKERSRS